MSANTYRTTISKDGITASVSALLSFMSCRRKFGFQYIDNLVPAIRSKPLSFGAAVHKALEVILSNKQKGRVTQKSETESAALGEYTQEEREESMPDPCVAAIAASHFYERYPTMGIDSVEAVELPFNVPLGDDHRLRLTGRLDGIVKISGKLYVLEHKTVRGEVSELKLNHLNVDLQASAYCYAARSLGYDIAGMIYSFIPKPTISKAKATPSDKLKFTKSGSLYSGQRMTDETDTEYLERVDNWYLSNVSLFRTHLVTRNKIQVAEFVGIARAIMSDMFDAYGRGAVSLYPNPASCSVYGCPYMSICIEKTDELLEANFIKKKQNEESVGDDND